MKHGSQISSAIALIVSLALGCGQKSTDATVKGQVTYKGQPVPRSSVAFFPAQGRAVVTATDDVGAYSTTLAPGTYKATVSVGVTLPPGWKEGDPMPKQAIELPVEYTTQARTKLSATIGPASEQSVDLKME
jgi:hypothetical protein